MKKSHFAIAGVLGAIGLVQIQVAAITPDNARKIVGGDRLLGSPPKPIAASAVARHRPGAGLRKVSAQSAAIATASTALAPLQPIRLLSSTREIALAPGGFGNAGTLLGATMQASSFVELPGSNNGHIATAYGGSYGVTASAQLAAGIGGSSFGSNFTAMIPGVGESGGFAGSGTIDNNYFSEFSALGAKGKQDTNDFVPLSMISAVPDVETWMTLLVGLGLVGFSLRRRPHLRDVAS